MGKEFDPRKPQAYLDELRHPEDPELGRSSHPRSASCRSCCWRWCWLAGRPSPLAARAGAPPALSEYDALVAGADADGAHSRPQRGGPARCPAPRDPFYDRGPNDKGIGIQLLHSLGRVFTGYLLALLVAMPLGFLVGMSPLMMRALDPVHPGAQADLAAGLDAAGAVHHQGLGPERHLRHLHLLALAGADQHRLRGGAASAATTSTWRARWSSAALRTALTVILPAAAPTIVTGMRISIGISWLVIVAAEMLVGGTGIGYYVWNEWNNLDLAAVIFAILVIGVVGMLLDRGLARAAPGASTLRGLRPMAKPFLYVENLAKRHPGARGRAGAGGVRGPRLRRRAAASS